MELSTEQIDKISDDFQSTFTQVRPGVLSNMFYEREIPKIEEIILRHVPKIDRLAFRQIEEISTDYFIWEIYVVFKCECGAKVQPSGFEAI